jgi:hypothetical protein
MNVSASASASRFALALAAAACARARPHAGVPAGAPVPWQTVEAETASTKATILGPAYDPYRLETEASGQKCVRLATAGDYVEFRAPENANAIVVRYSVPDSPDGVGQDGRLALLINGKAGRTLTVSSRRSWLYGKYPFSNDAADGKPRNFFDEVRAKDLSIAKGDTVRLELPADAKVEVTVDLLDFENVPPPLQAPVRALSLIDFGAQPDGVADATNALRQGIAVAEKAKLPLWIPAGEYKITGDIDVPSGVELQGAGMWHTTFVGDEALYPKADRRVRFRLRGERIRLADFALLGKLNYRNDQEPNDGIVTAGCKDSSIERIWIEHTKVGIWVYNGVRLHIADCRLRDLLADGVNLCVGTSECVIENCSARNAGDDCFAIWPCPSDQGFVQASKPGHNIIRHCTGQLPFLANGGAIYGGESNRITDCLFTDITAGCGVLISSTFPTTDEAKHIDNNFSGETVVEHCELLRCGGYDHDWAWRGALQICLDHHSISGLTIRDVNIDDSFSDGITIIAPGSAKGEGTLSKSRLEDVRVRSPGIGVATGAKHGLLVYANAEGGVTLKQAELGAVENQSKGFSIKTSN